MTAWDTALFVVLVLAFVGWGLLFVDVVRGRGGRFWPAVAVALVAVDVAWAFVEHLAKVLG